MGIDYNYSIAEYTELVAQFSFFFITTCYINIMKL